MQSEEAKAGRSPKGITRCRYEIVSSYHAAGEWAQEVHMFDLLAQSWDE